MMDVLATSPLHIYTHIAVKVATDPELQNSICSISNSCLCSVQRQARKYCAHLSTLVASTVRFHDTCLITFIYHSSVLEQCFLFCWFFGFWGFLMLHILRFSLIFTFVTVDFDPLHACLCFINENRAKLPESVYSHPTALVQQDLAIAAPLLVLVCLNLPRISIFIPILHFKIRA